MHDARQMESAGLSEWVGANDIQQLRFGNNVLLFVKAKNVQYAFPRCLLVYNLNRVPGEEEKGKVNRAKG